MSLTSGQMNAPDDVCRKAAAQKLPTDGVMLSGSETVSGWLSGDARSRGGRRCKRKDFLPTISQAKGQSHASVQGRFHPVEEMAFPDGEHGSFRQPRLFFSPIQASACQSRLEKERNYVRNHYHN